VNDYEYLSSQIYLKLLHYPLPKISKELQKEAFHNEESLFKLKLLDFNEKVMEMSAIEFDAISLDRIPKQNEEACIEITKCLFTALKTALRIQQDRNTEDNDSKGEKIKNYRKFCDML